VKIAFGIIATLAVFYFIDYGVFWVIGNFLNSLVGYLFYSALTAINGYDASTAIKKADEVMMNAADLRNIVSVISKVVYGLQIVIVLIVCVQCIIILKANQGQH
jgi:hypothetical protein